MTIYNLQFTIVKLPQNMLACLVEYFVECIVACLMECLVEDFVECLVECLVEQSVDKLVEASRFFYKYQVISFVILTFSLSFCKEFKDCIYIVNMLYIFNFSILFLTFRTFTFRTLLSALYFSHFYFQHFYFQYFTFNYAPLLSVIVVVLLLLPISFMFSS